MKRFLYRQGLVLQVESGDGRFGYIYALAKTPQFGTLFAIVKTPFPSPLDSERLGALTSAPFEPAYVNTAYGLNGPCSTCEWTQVGQLDVTCIMPTFFYGSEYTVMTIDFPDGSKEYVRGPVDLKKFEDEMFARGFIQQVLWLPENIAEYIFQKRPLRWSEHKKY